MVGLVEMFFIFSCDLGMWFKTDSLSSTSVMIEETYEDNLISLRKLSIVHTTKSTWTNKQTNPNITPAFLFIRLFNLWFLRITHLLHGGDMWFIGNRNQPHYAKESFTIVKPCIFDSIKDKLSCINWPIFARGHQCNIHSYNSLSNFPYTSPKSFLHIFLIRT